MDKIYKSYTETTLQVRGEYKEYLSFNKEVAGFKLPDGRIVRPAFCLEVEPANGVDFKYITSELDMKSLGFELQEYDRVEFIIHLKASIDLEVNTIKNMPLKELPLHLNDLEYKTSKELLEKRLKRSRKCHK